ncbi:MAG TPA: hypothetical protein DCY95_21145, partial [Algoriphagus sp.]|nr:hypothetical protein [Algoriphagus sp.]
GLEIVKKIPLIIGLYIAISQNIFFLLYLQVGLNIFYYLLNSSYSGKMIGYSIKDQLKDLLPIFIPILVSGLGVYLLLKTFSSWPNFLLISGGFIIGFGLYLSFSWLIKLEPLLFLKKEFAKK